MILTYFSLVVMILSVAQVNSWHGITPLKSTRADVEKLLGRPTLDTKARYAADYMTNNEKVFVLYSTGPCDVKPSNGWKIPADTVVRVSVTPKTKPTFASLNLDQTIYEKRPDPEVLQFTYYTNKQDGITVTVNTDDGLVTAFDYFPMAKDDHLRCSDLPERSETLTFRPYKIDEYFQSPILNERKRLDRFAKLLQRFPLGQGYIFAYPAKKTKPGVASIDAKRAKNYLVKVGIDRQRIQAIEGGQREKETIELYLVPAGVLAPAPSPPPNSAKIANNGRN